MPSQKMSTAGSSLPCHEPALLRRLRFIPATGTKGHVTRTYRRLAPFYGVWPWLFESRAAKRALQWANVSDGERVLEVAAGTGMLFKKIARQNPRGSNYGVDLTPAMLARAKTKMRPGPLNWSLAAADAYALPFQDDAFDLIINNYMFDLLPEQDFTGVLAEFRRVLKPSGRIVIVAMALGRSWYGRLWERVLRRAPGLLAGCRPVSLEEDVAEAGFHMVRVGYISQLTFPSQIVYGENYR